MRRTKAKSKILLPDPKFGDKVVTNGYTIGSERVVFVVCIFPTILCRLSKGNCIGQAFLFHTYDCYRNTYKKHKFLR